MFGRTLGYGVETKIVCAEEHFPQAIYYVELWESRLLCTAYLQQKHQMDYML